MLISCHPQPYKNSDRYSRIHHNHRAGT